MKHKSDVYARTERDGILFEYRQDAYTAKVTVTDREGNKSDCGVTAVGGLDAKLYLDMFADRYMELYKDYIPKSE